MHFRRIRVLFYLAYRNDINEHQKNNVISENDPNLSNTIDAHKASMNIMNISLNFITQAYQFYSICG